MVAGPPAVPLAVHLRGPNGGSFNSSTGPPPPTARRPHVRDLQLWLVELRDVEPAKPRHEPGAPLLLACHTRRRAVKKTRLGTGKEREAGRGMWPSFLLLLCKRVPKLGRAVVLDALLENENAAWSARESETLLPTQRASSPPAWPSSMSQAHRDRRAGTPLHPSLRVM